MKKYWISFLAAIFFLPLFFGCMPHTTGETEVGVRTKKIALFGQKGVENKVYPPGSMYFFWLATIFRHTGKYQTAVILKESEHEYAKNTDHRYLGFASLHRIGQRR